MIGQRRHENAETDRPGFAIARRKNQREQLRLVADLRDGDRGQ
jgi:hypothetical protein